MVVSAAPMTRTSLAPRATTDHKVVVVVVIVAAAAAE